MARSRIVAILALASLWMAAPRLCAQQPTKPTIDSLKLPAGTVILVTPNPRDVNPAVDAVILTPEAYRKLLESAEQVRKQGVAEVPNVCRLEARYEPTKNADVVYVTARYHVRPAAAQSQVTLGLNRGRPVTIRGDDGKTPTIVPGKDGNGFVLIADSTKEQQFSVDVEVPLNIRGNESERGFQLGLPGSAITTLEKLSLPDGLRRVRINERDRPTQADSIVVLGPATTLDIVWEPPPAPVVGDPLIACDGAIDVRFEDRSITTTSRMTMSVLRGQVGEFKFATNPNAKVTLQPVAGEKAATIEAPTNGKRIWTVRRTASTNPLTVEIQSQTQVPPLGSSNRKPLAVPGISVEGAVIQRGTVTITAPPHYRLNVTSKADLTRKDETDPNKNERREIYTYWSLPAQGPLLEFDPQPVRGELGAFAAHHLRRGASDWQLVSDFEFRPNRLTAESVTFDMPSEWQDVRIGPPELVESAIPSRDGRTWTVRLSDIQRQRFTVTIEAARPSDRSGLATLKLPSVLQAADRGGTVKVTIPPGFDVRGSVRGRNNEGEYPLETGSKPAKPGVMSAAFGRGPAQVELDWSAREFDQQQSMSIDVELEDRKVMVRQTIPSRAGQKTLRFHGPAELAGAVRCEGATLASEVPGEWLARPTGEVPVVLIHQLPLPSVSNRSEFAVPILWPEGCNCDARVQVWAAGNAWPEYLGGVWEKRPVESVNDSPRLPVLALRGRGVDLPLKLSFTESGGGYGPGVFADRVWIQAGVDSEGHESIRTRFALRTIRSESLSFDLPHPVNDIDYSVLLNGKVVTAKAVGSTIVVHVDVLLDQPMQILDIAYRMECDSGHNTTFVPPRPSPTLPIGQVRWQIATPANEIALDLSAAIDESSRWAWDHGRLAPIPAYTSATLSRWLNGSPRTASTEANESFTATLAGRSALAPLTITRVSRAALTLIVSCMVLTIGVMALNLKWSKMNWALMVLCVVLLGCAALMRPQLMGELLVACQPGLVVLVFTCLVSRWWRRRVARRAVFAPYRTAQLTKLLSVGNGRHAMTVPETATPAAT